MPPSRQFSPNKRTYGGSSRESRATVITTRNNMSTRENNGGALAAVYAVSFIAYTPVAAYTRGRRGEGVNLGHKPPLHKLFKDDSGEDE